MKYTDLVRAGHKMLYKGMYGDKLRLLRRVSLSSSVISLSMLVIVTIFTALLIQEC